MNDTDPQRLTTAIGIEPYLERVFVFGDLPIARVLVLMSLAIWSLVLVTFLFTTLYRYILLKLLTDRDRRLLESHGRLLRRLAQRTRLSGYVTLLVTFVVAMLFLQSGVRHAVQALIWGALGFLGVALPTSLIADLFGRMFESRGPMEGKR
jgi:hypothetical protein